jgi:hypothetical protein
MVCSVGSRRMTEPLLDPLALLAGMVLEDSSRWGEVAEDAQWADARAVLDLAGPRWHFLLRSRGRSKTTDVAGLTLAAMVAGQIPPGAECYAAAADRDQAQLLVRKVAGLVQRTPELAGLVEVETWRVSVPSRGVELRVLSADASSSWGLTPTWLVVDEIANFPSTNNAKQFYTSLATSLPKVLTSRAVLMSTPGDPASHWKRVYDSAVVSPLWRVSLLRGAPPWMSEAELDDQRRTLLPSHFARLYECEWTAGEDRLVDEAALDACRQLDGEVLPQPGRYYAIGLDVGLKIDPTVAVVCHAEFEKVPPLPAAPVLAEEWSLVSPIADPPTIGDARSGRIGGRTHSAYDRPMTIVLDKINLWQGTSKAPVLLERVEDWLATQSKAYYNAPVVFDPSQAWGSMQRLAQRGVRSEEWVYTPRNMARAFWALYTMLNERKMLLPKDDLELRTELLNIRIRENALGVTRMDHDSGMHDDRGQALSLAVQHLLAHGMPGAATRFFDQLLEDQSRGSYGGGGNPLAGLG